MSPLIKPLLTYSFLILYSVCFSQKNSFTLPNNDFFRFIRQERFENCQFIPLATNRINILDFNGSNFKTYPQTLHSKDGQLYIFINASGLVYKSIGDINNDSITFNRVDKTEHVGYNINSFPFVYDKKLYNLGGYGFWRWTGHLRVFNESVREWDIVPLNREVLVSMYPPGNHLWKSKDGNEIYCLGYVGGNDAITKENGGTIRTIDSVMKLDLKSGKWSSVGSLNKRLHQFLDGLNIRAYLDSGLLIHKNNNDIEYVNLVSNKIYLLSNSEKKHFLITQKVGKVTWFYNKKIYFSHPSDTKIDSLEINHNDFTYSGEEVYLTTSEKKTNFYFAFLLLTGIGLAYGFIRKSQKGKKSAIAQFSAREDKLKSPYPMKELFDEVEKALILHLLDNISIRKKRTGTDEVNRILGVANKSGDMQKRKRSDIIRSINGKYNLLTQDMEVQAIERIKSDLDARLYEYYINEKTIETIRKHLD